MYATKRRRRNVKPSLKGSTNINADPPKSNPSKRHRERLNAELDTLASLLPFEQNVITKLDRLSILRLSVSYLRTKSYFQVVLNQGRIGGDTSLDTYRHHHTSQEIFQLKPQIDVNDINLALHGFLMILTSEGEVFFVSSGIETYLGFHQSDIVHQSVYELIHSEDREELRRQLAWSAFLPPERLNMSLHELMLPENCQYLERCFTLRFRCLLDNTSGFLRLEMRGRMMLLNGQNLRTCEDQPLAFFAICCPFGPPSMMDIPQREVMFKSKHKLDLCIISMEPRGKLLLGYEDNDLANKGGYDIIHYDDLTYVAAAHQELLKTGASGLIAYRMLMKDGGWQWLQTSCRMVYKSSKPDFIICTHRPLLEEEGRDLMSKRNADFKLAFFQPQLLASSMYDFDSDVDYLMPGVKQVRARKSKKDLLNTSRQRGFLDAEALNGSLLTPSIKPEVVYNYPSIEYVTHPLYPPEFDSRFLHATDDHRFTCYPNGYYSDHRQFATSLPYSSSTAKSSKYGYDLQRHCYPEVGYGLDVCKAGVYSNGAALLKEDTSAVNFSSVAENPLKDLDARHHNPFYQNPSILSSDQLLCNMSAQYSTSYDFLCGSEPYYSIQSKTLEERNKTKSCRVVGNVLRRSYSDSQRDELSAAFKLQTDVRQPTWPSPNQASSMWCASSLTNGGSPHSSPNPDTSKYGASQKSCAVVSEQQRTLEIPANGAHNSCTKASVIKSAWLPHPTIPSNHNSRIRESCIISTGSVIRCANDAEVAIQKAVNDGAINPLLSFSEVTNTLLNH